MADGGVVPGIPILTTIKKRWRAWLRAIHRDVGYLAVGLTVVYAVSGLAINHIADWDPNFTSVERQQTIEPIDPALDDDAAIALAMQRLDLRGKPRSTYRAGDEVHLDFDDGKIVIIGDQVTEQRRKPRFFLRVANWLHYNRGKRAWTYVADVYAVLLLYLAISGLFMLKGRLGLRWRGALLVGAGVAVPLGYVVWSGGPDAANRRAAAAAPGEPAAPTPAPAGEAPADPAPAADSDDDDEFARPKSRVPGIE